MAVVVAQLVERSLPTPKIRSLNPVIGNFDLLSTEIKRQKERKNRSIFKNIVTYKLLF